MANEITITAKLLCQNGNFEASTNASRISVTQSALGCQKAVQEIGTSYEQVILGDVSTEGYAMFRNLDATNFIQLGLDGGASLTPVVRLKAGEVALFRIDAGATIFAKADTAACDLDVLILEN